MASNLKYQPVRVLGFAFSATAVALGVIQQVQQSWDKSSGWVGLGFALVLAVSTEYTARTKTRSTASLADEVQASAAVQTTSASNVGTPANATSPSLGAHAATTGEHDV